MEKPTYPYCSIISLIVLVMAPIKTAKSFGKSGVGWGRVVGWVANKILVLEKGALVWF